MILASFLVGLGRIGESATMLRHLLHHGEVIALKAASMGEILQFRHDRVRDSLLSDAIAHKLRSNVLSNDLLQEPYFAEVMGSALLSRDVPIAAVGHFTIENPLALSSARTVLVF